VADTLKKAVWQWLPVIILSAMLVISLTLLNMSTISPQMAGRYEEWQLYLNGGVLVILSAIILFNLASVLYQWRTQQAGSRFTLRLMTGFLILTLLPTVIVSAFSMNFIGKRIDRWFESSARFGNGLDDAVELAQISLDMMSRQHLAELRRLAVVVQNEKWRRVDLIAQLDQFVAETGAQEVLLLSNAQRLEAVSVAGTGTLVPHFPARELFRAMSLSADDSYYHLEPVGDENLFSRVALKVSYNDPQGNYQEAGILTALYPVSDKWRELTTSLEDANSNFKSFNYQRELLKDAFRLTLLLVMVITVSFALSIAFVFSRRLTQPIRTLVEGTLAVAAGDLDKKLPVSDRDDFSMLARSFNTMTKRLSDARQEREQARRQLQQEHDYLHVVLEHLSSGVITLDENGIIRRMNSAASHVFQVAIKDGVGRCVQDLAQQTPHLQPFLSAVCPHLQQVHNEGEWQEEISLTTPEGRVLLVCRGAALPAKASPQASGALGSVLVFDDVTDLIQAEHDAAWGEVARRLAHEIKNPLTPIQLSAERLTRKLSGELNEESANFLKRMTNTIIQQVDALKAMVNAFSQYARAPSLHLQRVDLNQLVQDVTDLYRLNEGRTRIQLQLDEAVPFLRLDINRMRQLLVNLIKNALEALEDQGQDGVVTITTQRQAAQQQALLTIQDNGPGIPPDLLPRLFEPYVTTKHKGTGLGLAIVKKIVEEHAGHLSARNSEAGGAMLSIRFPLDVEADKEQGK
jgi:nitrogen fixation/metabolism regulation signal transduction histidine kinase